MRFATSFLSFLGMVDIIALRNNRDSLVGNLWFVRAIGCNV